MAGGSGHGGLRGGRRGGGLGVGVALAAGGEQGGARQRKQRQHPETGERNIVENAWRPYGGTGTTSLPSPPGSGAGRVLASGGFERVVAHQPASAGELGPVHRLVGEPVQLQPVQVRLVLRAADADVGGNAAIGRSRQHLDPGADAVLRRSGRRAGRAGTRPRPSADPFALAQATGMRALHHATSTRSPAAWPCASLIGLRLSRSTTNSTKGTSPLRIAPTSRAIACSQPRRFIAPVSESSKAWRSSSRTPASMPCRQRWMPCSRRPRSSLPVDGSARQGLVLVIGIERIGGAAQRLEQVEDQHHRQHASHQRDRKPDRNSRGSSVPASARCWRAARPPAPASAGRCSTTPRPAAWRDRTAERRAKARDRVSSPVGLAPWFGAQITPRVVTGRTQNLRRGRDGQVRNWIPRA